MGPPMDEERVQRMMSDPNVQQSMNEALSNPDFVNMLIESNPMLRNMPNAREIITSPFMRQMMTNPQMMSQAMRMQRNMQGGGASFPAPGATDNSGDSAAEGTGATAGGDASNNQANPFMNPFMMPGMGAGAGGNGEGLSSMLQALGSMGMNPYGGSPAGNQTGAAATAGEGATGAAASGQTGTTGESNRTEASSGTGSNQTQNPANPFAALFPQGGANQANQANQGNQGNPANPFGMNPEMMQQMLQMMGGGGAPSAPADNRPPEERYAEQLRQLNDMGFFDFDRNVAALRRSGGSVQGAVEHLLNSI